MGQKINPKIFRVGLYKNEWDSYYMEKNKEESTLLIYNDIKIRHFLSRIFLLNGLLVHSCKLRYTLESVYVSISYLKLLKQESFLDNTSDLVRITNTIHFFLNNGQFFSTNHKVLLQVKDINVYARDLVYLKMDHLNKLFRRHLKDKVFDDLLKVLILSLLINNSASFLVNFLILKLKVIKGQNKVLFYLKLILVELIKKDIFRVKGIKFVINGRFNKAARSRKKDILLGSVPLQSIRAKIDYFQSVVYTVVGTFGIKLWICRK